MSGEPYPGIDNLEVLREARNYAGFLGDLIARDAPRHGRIVDFGAGTGDFACRLDAIGRDILCVEPDRTLRSMLADRGLRAVESIEPVADASLDFIYSLNVLEHIGDDAAVARLWRRKLRPGGRLLVYVPAFACLFTSMDRKVGHRRRYTRATLPPLLDDAGFRVVEARYVDSLGFFATLIFRLIDPGDGTINRRALIVYDRLAFPLSRLLDRPAGRIFGKNLVVRAIRSR